MLRFSARCDSECRESTRRRRQSCWSRASAWPGPLREVIGRLLAYSLTLVYVVSQLVPGGCSRDGHVQCRQRAQHLPCAQGRREPCPAHVPYSTGRRAVNAEEAVPLVLWGRWGGDRGRGWERAVQGGLRQFSPRRRCSSRRGGWGWEEVVDPGAEAARRESSGHRGHGGCGPASRAPRPGCRLRLWGQVSQALAGHTPV